MSKRWLSCAGLLLAVLLGGCAKSGMAQAGGSPATNAPAAVQGTPQPRLRTMKLWVGAEEMVIEVASTLEQVRTGMMFRTKMEENEGMLFVFAQPHQASFWMHNTLLPLSCAYIDSEGKILELHDMKPLDETSIVAATDRVQYVLETRQGWFQRHKITVGMVMRTERGSFAETFMRGQSQ